MQGREVRGGRGASSFFFSSNLPFQVFDFGLEERLQCSETLCVGYKTQKEKILLLPIPVEAATNLPEVQEYNLREAGKSEDEKKEEERERRAAGIPDPEPVRPLVPLSACLNSFCAAEQIDGWFSPAAQKVTFCVKERRFTNFPKYLIFQMGRFLISGMELKKLGT